MKRALVTVIWAISVLGLSAVGGTARATYPGLNGRIVFAADTDRGSQLFTVGANGKDLRQITHVKGDAMKPDWSPDGRRIVFEFDRPDGTCSIDLVNRDGSGLVSLSGHRNDCENDPSFAPDGRSVVFVHSTFTFESIWRMNLTGGDRDLIVPAPAGLHAEDPNVSPDGTELSFIVEKVGRHALFVVNMDGSDQRKVVGFRFDISTKADWAPDGTRIIFSEYANEPQKPGNIATIRPDGTGLRYVTHYSSSNVHATVGPYLPDGRQIVVRIQNQDQLGLYRMCACGRGPVPILAPVTLLPRGNDWGAAPGPARARTSLRNEKIVFGRWNQALSDTVIYTMNADGTNVKKLSQGAAECPRWSPDGTRIATCGSPTGAAVRIYDPADLSFVDLPMVDPAVLFTAGSLWSPDGHHFALEGFGQTRGSLNGIYTIRSSDGRGLRRITSNPGGDDNPFDYAPDDSRIGFIRTTRNGTQALYTVKLNGGGLHRITPATLSDYEVRPGRPGATR